MIPPFIPWWLFLDDDEEEELLNTNDDFSLIDLIIEMIKEDWNDFKIKIKKFFRK